MSPTDEVIEARRAVMAQLKRNMQRLEEALEPDAKAHAEVKDDFADCAEEIGCATFKPQSDEEKVHEKCVSGWWARRTIQREKEKAKAAEARAKAAEESGQKVWSERNEVWTLLRNSGVDMSGAGNQIAAVGFLIGALRNAERSAKQADDALAIATRAAKEWRKDCESAEARIAEALLHVEDRCPCVDADECLAVAQRLLSSSEPKSEGKERCSKCERDFSREEGWAILCGSCFDTVPTSNPKPREECGYRLNRAFVCCMPNGHAGEHGVDVLLSPEPKPEEVAPAEDPLLEFLKEILELSGNCRTDYQGYCQSHGWLTASMRCPHARARELVKAGGR